ncbi:MAG: DUF456 domain-containing protein [Treponema sp.]|nr:DUF456 domain-containing protein [Treponema sp.]
MEILLVIIAFLLLLAGLAGSIVPAIPGPPLGYAGLLLLQWSGRADFSAAFLWVWAGIAVAVTVMDNILPAIMTKRFGGSRMAVIGSLVGLVIGMIFFAPLGILLGPFLGALAGELLHGRLKGDEGSGGFKALKVAAGAFLAFIVGTGAKLIVGALMIFFAARAVFFS